jgi:hypothetical protein
VDRGLVQKQHYVRYSLSGDHELSSSTCEMRPLLQIVCASMLHQVKEVLSTTPHFWAFTNLQPGTKR